MKLFFRESWNSLYVCFPLQLFKEMVRIMVITNHPITLRDNPLQSFQKSAHAQIEQKRQTQRLTDEDKTPQTTLLWEFKNLSCIFIQISMGV